jgi:hypothetical protein
VLLIWPCQTFNPTFGLLGFARTTTLIYSQGVFRAEKKEKKPMSTEKKHTLMFLNGCRFRVSNKSKTFKN